MDTIVLKFGGSSVADNDKLKIVAEKIINLYNKNNNIVVILSAQGNRLAGRNTYRQYKSKCNYRKY